MWSTMMHLPKPLEEGDEITIAGLLLEDAKQMQVNFTTDASEDDPADVIYQFKVNSNKVLQNWKSGGQWMCDECTNTDTFILSDQNLILTFKFINNEILVYSGDQGRNFECQFRLYEPMSNITAVIINGDIQRVSEVTFRYA